MAFRALFLSHAPDADKDVHRCEINTGMYRLWTVVVRGQDEAVEVASQFAQKEGIDAVLLCPGFTHADVAEIKAAVGDRVAVGVARCDGPGGRVSAAARKREGYGG